MDVMWCVCGVQKTGVNRLNLQFLNRWRDLKCERRIHEAILPLLRKCLPSR